MSQKNFNEQTDKRIHQLFEEQAEKRPDAPALIIEEDKLTYKELNAQANQLAHHLISLGAGPDVLIGICVERSSDMIAGLLGILKAGSAYLPIDPEYPRERIRFMLGDAKPDFLLAQEKTEDRISVSAARIISFDTDRSVIDSNPAENPANRAEPHHLAYVMYTSGSTGNPKGVMTEHRGLPNLVAAQRQLFKLGTGSRILQLASLSFDASIFEIIMALCSGGALCLAQKEDLLPGSALTQTLNNYQITHVTLSPSALSLMDDKDISSLHTIIVVGEPCHPDIAATWSENHRQFFNLYGVTEATAWSCAMEYKHSDNPGSQLHIGRPIANTQAYILDTDLSPLPAGVPGELHIGGIGLARGYLNAPDLTKEKFIPNPFEKDTEKNDKNSDSRLYKTGDMCRWLPDGNIELLGRIDFQVKFGGHRIELGEIEAMLCRHPKIKSAAVILREDTPGDRRIVAYPVCRETPAPSIRELRSVLKQKLPDYMIPVAFVMLDRLPVTPNGKIDRKGLPAPDTGRPELDTPYVPPLTRMEHVVADLWQEVLGLKKIGIDDNFFELGGDSLKGALFINKLQAISGARLFMVLLFKSPTISQIVSHLNDHYPDAVRKITGQGLAGKKEIEVITEIDSDMISETRHKLELSSTCPQNVSGDIRTKNAQAVFVLCPPRSGSTLLRVMLAGHPELFAPPELMLLSFQSLEQRKNAIPEHLQFLLDGTIRAVMEIMNCDVEDAREIISGYEKENMKTPAFYRFIQEKLGKKRLIDKSTSYPFHLSTLEQAETHFKDPLYIRLWRHPYGMIRSFETLRMDQLLYFDVPSFPSRSIAELLWIISHQNISEFFRSVPDERKYELRFEDLLNQPEDIMRDISGFLGIEAHPDLWHPYTNPSGRMADGLYGESASHSKTVGDIKFHEHQDIDPRVAYNWKKDHTDDFLSAIGWEIAESAGYKKSEAFPAQTENVIFPEFQIVPEPENRPIPFPLTDMQQAYWIGRSNAFELGNVAAHAYTETESATLDIRRFETALNRLIRRHDMLRAVILPDGRQQILENVPYYEIEIADLRDMESNAREAALSATRDRMSHQILSCDAWPLFEITASRLENNRIRVHLSIDGLMFDVRSKYIFFNDWAYFYENTDAVLPDNALSFRDYVLTEDKIRDSEMFRSSRDYWLKRIPELPGPPELPLSAKRIASDSHKFMQLPYHLDKKTWSCLKTRASKANLTPSGLLLSVFAEVTRLWSHKSRFTINLTHFNRLPLHPEVNEIIGDFTALLLFDTGEQIHGAFETRARSLQEQLWNDMDNSFFSGLQVLREIAKQRRETPKAEMPVIFTSALSDEIRQKNQKMTDWIGDTVYTVSQTPQVWLDHVVFEEAGELQGRWNVVKGLFPEGMPEDMLAAYRTFLNRLAESEEPWQEDRNASKRILVPEHQMRQREAVNATQTEVSEETLHSLFVSRAKQQPEKTAVVSPDRNLSYSELHEISNQIGNRLIKMGASPNTLIAVVMEKGWEQVAAVMGILASGAAYLPIDPGLPKERLSYLLEHGKAEIVLTQPRLSNLAEWSDKIQCLTVDDETFSKENKKSPQVRQKPEDLAYVIFTSGSTGLPKGVVIDHRGAVNTILDINRRFDVTDKDSVLALSSLTFDLSVYDIFGVLAAGGTVVMPKPSDMRDPSKWAERVCDNTVTVWNTVPALMGLLTEYVQNRSDMTLRSLRLIMMSGDWIPPTLPEKIRQITDDPKIISLGGATEASVWSIFYPIETVDSSWKSIPYGKPMANQQFHVLNDAMEPCPVWVPGMLYIGGIGLAKGYWRDKEKTDKAFVIHPRSQERLYRTGDLGRYLPDGNIEFLGREDFQVKIQGFRVELGEIESALIQHPNIEKTVVEARGERHAEKHLFAYIVPEQTPAPDPNDLRLFLKTKLPEYMVPSVYVALDELPLTTNGKIDRNALPEPSCEQFSSEKSDITSSESLKRIAGFVEQIMGTDKIEYDMNLLNLGATSIHIIRIANEMEAELGFRPEIDDFYSDPCIRRLAAAYEAATDEPLPETTSEDAAISGCPENILKKFDFIADPDDRQAFKDRQLGIRHPDKPFVELMTSQSDEMRKRYETRRSYRSFSSENISFENFSEFLSCMRQGSLSGKPKYLYGSAGGTYPVQVYVYIKPERVEAVDPGTYYYHPVNHRLMLLSDDPDIPQNTYDTFTNRPIFEHAAFGIFLIAQMEAIVPLYKERSLHYAVIEAGLISQLLETFAPDYGIGLCQIGNFDFHRIRHLFDLDENHLLVHSLLGGIPDNAAPEWAPVNESHHITDTDNDREEGEI